MEQNDIDYLSDSLSEVYSQFFSMMYVPLDNDLTKLNKFGEKVAYFNTEKAFTVYGILSLDLNTSKELDRDAPRTEANNRTDGSIDLVLKQVKLQGLRINLGDAIDVINEYGDSDRYTIIGVDKKLEIPYIVTKLRVVLTANLVGE